MTAQLLTLLPLIGNVEILGHWHFGFMIWLLFAHFLPFSVKRVVNWHVFSVFCLSMFYGVLLFSVYVFICNYLFSRNLLHNSGRNAPPSYLRHLLVLCLSYTSRPDPSHCGLRLDISFFTLNLSPMMAAMHTWQRPWVLAPCACLRSPLGPLD